MTDVILKPQRLDLYRNSSLEPQYITKREPNRAIIYVESNDNKQEKTLNNMISSTSRVAGEYPSVLATGVSRISINSFGIRYCIPNVNPRNNEITFYSSASGNNHTVSLVEGYYPSSVGLITDIVNRLNTVTGASGLTFSFLNNPLFPDRYDLNSTGGNYYFDLNCSAVKKGYTLYCLPIDQTPTNTKIVGNMGLFYTTFVDLCSSTLTKYVKLKNATTTRTNNVVLRCHFVEPTLFNKIVFINESSAPDIQFNFNTDEPITTIDFELRDQFGDLLYVPQNADGTYRGFWWNTGVIIEC